jgi:hypothetical protein
MWSRGQFPSPFRPSWRLLPLRWECTLEGSTFSALSDAASVHSRSCSMSGRRLFHSQPEDELCPIKIVLIGTPLCKLTCSQGSHKQPVRHCSLFIIYVRYFQTKLKLSLTRRLARQKAIGHGVWQTDSKHLFLRTSRRRRLIRRVIMEVNQGTGCLLVIRHTVIMEPKMSSCACSRGAVCLGQYFGHGGGWSRHYCSERQGRNRRGNPPQTSVPCASACSETQSTTVQHERTGQSNWLDVNICFYSAHHHRLQSSWSSSGCWYEYAFVLSLLNWWINFYLCITTYRM